MPDTDPIVLGAQARVMLAKLHGRNDVVVQFKTDFSGYSEDALSDEDKEMPGHFKDDVNKLTFNLDKLITANKSRPKSLATIEDWRQHPVLAGVAAHESGHAKWTNWNVLPDSIPNKDFRDVSETVPATTKAEDSRYREFANEEDDALDDAGWFAAKGPGTKKNPDWAGPERFPVSEKGKLLELANYLEEPRIERLAKGNFTKTWKRALEYSAAHLILEQVEEMNEADIDPVQSALRLAITVGGRVTAGTLGVTEDSRKAVKKILDNAQKIVEATVAQQEHPVSKDPFHEIMGLVNKEIFSNDHDEATPHLETARRILAILEPQNSDNPDEPNGNGDGEGGGGGSAFGPGEPGEGEGEGEGSDPTGEMQKLLSDMMEGVEAALEAERRVAESEAEDPGHDNSKNKSTGDGSTLYKNPRAPQTAELVDPDDADQQMYREAKAWMEKQIQPTVSETAEGQWLPAGGARLNVAQHIRDNLRGVVATERHDWDRVSEIVKPAPPVKTAIMLDGSGSMSSYARFSARVAWATANAAGDLPGSLTVSVVYGNAAQITQDVGQFAPRQVAISNTDGGTEDFYSAAILVEDALELNDTIEDEQENVLIIIVSDLLYHGTAATGEPQGVVFTRKMQEWSARGYQILVIGADRRGDYGDKVWPKLGVSTENVRMGKSDDLFKD